MLKNFGIFILTFGFISSALAASTNLTDAEIAKVLITINEGEIDAGKMAESKAQNAEVKSFAKMMQEEHKLHAKTLQAKDKNSFDKAYAQMMVQGHEKVLKTLDETLIPAAKDPEFKGHLVKTRGAVAAHLSHAKDLDSKIQ